MYDITYSGTMLPPSAGATAIWHRYSLLAIRVDRTVRVWGRGPVCTVHANPGGPFAALPRPLDRDAVPPRACFAARRGEGRLHDRRWRGAGGGDAAPRGQAPHPLGEPSPHRRGGPRGPGFQILGD
eukprot:scaffold4492_cov371-Prasinococcus_capsulatus_cf.AAC.1